MINDLPSRYGKVELLSFRMLELWGLTPQKIETLYDKLTDSTFAEDINNGVVEDIPEKDTIRRRLEHLKYSIRQIGKVKDIELVYGDEIPTINILFEIMDYAEAYDYVDTAGAILVKWNEVVDGVNDVISEIENHFLNPQPDTSTEQEQTNNILPPELATPQAMIIWSKAKHNGWIDEDYNFIGNKQQMCYAADIMGESLKLKHKWKPFIELWKYKSMAQTRWRGMKGYEPIPKMNELKKIFST